MAYENPNIIRSSYVKLHDIMETDNLQQTHHVPGVSVQVEENIKSENSYESLDRSDINIVKTESPRIETQISYTDKLEEIMKAEKSRKKQLQCTNINVKLEVDLKVENSPTTQEPYTDVNVKMEMPDESSHNTHIDVKLEDGILPQFVTSEESSTAHRHDQTYNTTSGSESIANTGSRSQGMESAVKAEQGHHFPQELSNRSRLSIPSSTSAFEPVYKKKKTIDLPETEFDDDDLLLLMAVSKPDDGLLALALYDTVEQRTWKEVTFNLESLSEEYCKYFFRFQKDDIPRLVQVFKIPNPIRLDNGTTVSATLGMCLLLRRLVYPCRLSYLSQIFGYAGSTLDDILTFMLSFIMNTHSHLLTDINQAWLKEPNIKLFAQKVAAKGAPLQNCWGFIDGTARKIVCPTYDQRDYSSGNKREHNMIQFQSVMAPNGLVANLSGPFEGKRPQGAILRESGLLDLLTNRMTFDKQPYCIYGDRTYPLRTHLMCPFKEPQLTSAQVAFNNRMATVRNCVEWGFGKTVSLFAFLDFSKNLKIYKQPVWQFYIVGVLLTNAHTCLYGSQTGDFFQLHAPTLEDYMK